MSFYTDLHLHSRYAYATSKHADLEHLSRFAQTKGISLMATGDFTHPKWRVDLREKLVAVDDGIFRLKPALNAEIEKLVPASCRAEFSFILVVEVSTVYYDGGKYRKIHHLIFVPDLAAADALSLRLAKYGNLEADGRPTLEISSRDLLEIVLEVDPRNFLVPAHIWTPWFGVLGSKTGYDSIEEAYKDLAPYVFAVETGLSADPEMCRRVPELDRFNIVSFSDAHSPGKLGRELTQLSGEIGYSKVRAALECGQGLVGTVEFFPEEGKYYLDGHRKCGVILTPVESKKLGGICPVCRKKLTLGVLHRVEELAARSVRKDRKAHNGKVVHMLSLVEILSEILGVGVTSKKVEKLYSELLQEFAPELVIIREVPLEDLESFGMPLLGEAIARMRREEVVATAGYDGVFGTIRLFKDGELKRK